MITRKALIEKLSSMNTSDVIVKYGDYRNCHPMQRTPLDKTLADLVGVKSIEARRYTNKRGVEHSSPAWLIEAYKKLAYLIYIGSDINVRALISVVK